MSEKQQKSKQEPVYWIPGVKGFNRDLTCRGFQFKEGETYQHDGDVEACSSGFHYCTNPLDVFGYYAPGQAVFHSVHGGGKVDLNHANDTKIACSEIEIGASISLHDIIDLSMQFFFRRKYSESGSSHMTGDQSAASSTGYKSAASSTGDQSAASSTGDQSAASSTGDQSAASSTGQGGAAVVTGLEGKAKAGAYGCIALAIWNKTDERSEMRCALIGCGDGSDGQLKADTWYQLNDQGEFVEVTGEEN